MIAGRSPGALLSDAASLARGSERLAIAALQRLEDAESETRDLAFVADADIGVVDLVALLNSLGIFTDNLLHLADAYGRAEVRLRRGES